MTTPLMPAPEVANLKRPPAFELTNISFAYGPTVPALREITFSVRGGESVAILGANGSGKSTLIKLLDGLIHPQGGSLRAFGEPLSERSMRDDRQAHRFRRRVGFVFQDADAQLFSPTVREEIAFGPLQMGLAVDDVETRVAELADLLSITTLLERAPFQLSGGEKRRVAIASSLAVNPDVLLLDEPTSGLDPRSQHWLAELLAMLNDAGKTIVLSTHDLGIVPVVAGRAIVISEDHRLAADGPSENILADTSLLLRVNLIHEHLHRHGNLVHSHPHYHDHEHSHDHSDLPDAHAS